VRGDAAVCETSGPKNHYAYEHSFAVGVRLVRPRVSVTSVMTSLSIIL